MRKNLLNILLVLAILTISIPLQFTTIGVASAACGNSTTPVLQSHVDQYQAHGLVYYDGFIYVANRADPTSGDNLWKLPVSDYSSPDSIPVAGVLYTLIREGEYLWSCGTSISKVSIASFTVSQEWYTGNLMQSLCSDGTYVYYAGSYGLVGKINISTGIRTQADVGSQAFHSMVEDGLYLYATDTVSNTLVKIQKSDLSIVGASASTGQCTDDAAQDDDYVYLGGEKAGMVLRVAKSDLSIVSTSPGGMGYSYGVFIVDAKLLNLDYQNNIIWVFSTPGLTLDYCVQLTGLAYSNGINELADDGTSLHLTQYSAGGISPIIKLNRNEVLPVAPAPTPTPTPTPAPTPTPTPAPGNGTINVTTGEASSIGNETATINGSFNEGNSTTVYTHFEYGTTIAYGGNTSEVPVAPGNLSISQTTYSSPGAYDPHAYLGTDHFTLIGETFTNMPSGTLISSIQLMLSKIGSPTGNLTVLAKTIATGSAGMTLGALSYLDVSTLTSTPSWYTFTGSISTSPYTSFRVCAYYAGGNVSDYVVAQVRYADVSAGGYLAFYPYPPGTSWIEDTVDDLTWATFTHTGTSDTFSANISSLSPNTTYHFRAVARYSGDPYYYGADNTFTTTGTDCPQVVTEYGSPYTTSAALYGSYAASSCSAYVTYQGFIWGGSSHLGDLTGLHPGQVVSLGYYVNYNIVPYAYGNFTCAATGLSPGTTYYFRACVRYNGVWYYGGEESFTTAQVEPEVQTEYATPATTTATLTGVLFDSAGYSQVYVSLRYGLTTAYGYTTSETLVAYASHTNPVWYSGNITSLSPSTLYHFQAVARYNTSQYAYGGDLTFTTLSVTSPTVTTNSYVNLTYNSVLLQGEVTSMGNQSEVYVSFQYGITPSYGAETPEQAITSASIKIFSYPLINLGAGITYHYQAILRYGTTRVYGADNSFTTLGYSNPTISTIVATNITNVSATLNGNLTDLGGYGSVYTSFKYSTDLIHWTTTTKVAKYVPTTFGQDITGLISGTTYYFQAIAFVAATPPIYVYGTQLSFLTLGVAPTPIPTPVVTPSSPCALHPVYATDNVSRLEPITGNETMIDIIGNDTYGVYGKVIAAQTFTTIAASHDVSYIKIFGYIVPGEATTTTSSTATGNSSDSSSTSSSTSTTTAITGVTLQLRSTHSTAKYPWKSDFYNSNGVKSELTLPYTPGAYYNAFATDTNGAWTEFNFTQSFQLEANTTYAIVISAPTGIMEENFQWYWGNTSDGNISDCPYDVGKAWTSTDGGKNWYEQDDMDFQFEIYGSAGLMFEPTYSVEVFNSYYQTGDWLITVAYKNVASPYYPHGGDISRLFTLQLLEISTCSTIAKGSLRNWDAGVASLYINAASAASLQWQGNYVVRIQSTYGGNFYIDYLLTNANWPGDNLSELDTWCIIEAGWMGEQNQNNKRYYLTASSNGDLLNDNGEALFDTGIQQLGAIRGSTLFATFLSVITPNPNSTPNPQLQSKYNYVTQLGAPLVGALTDVGTPFSLTPDAVGLIVVLALYVMVVGSAFPLGHGLAGTTAGLIIILIGMTAGLVQVTWVILAIIFAVAMMLRQMLLVGQ